jgi:hypothetical protein
MKKLIRVMVVPKIIFAIVLFMSLLVWTNTRLSKDITKWVDDEYHSIYLSSQHLFSEVVDSRVFGGVRDVSRLTYPFSLYYMNTRMGGEHYVTGWDYPGHFYVKKNLKPHGAIAQDPNLQDFVFSQRTIFSTIFALSLVFACFTLWTVVSPWSALLYAGLIVSSTIVRHEWLYVYADLLMAAIANAIFALLLLSYNSKKPYLALLTIFTAMAVSTKLNGFLLALPVLIHMYRNRELVKDSIVRLSILFISCVFIFNIYEMASPESFLHYTLANVYHYKTGHLITQPDGLFQVKSAIKALGTVFFTALAAVAIYLLDAKSKYKVLLFSLLLLVALYFASLAGARIFVPRNYIVIAISLALFSSIVFGEVLQRYAPGKKFADRFCVFTVCGLFVFAMAQHFSNNPVERWKNDLSTCSRIGVIGSIDTERIGPYFSIPSIPDTYNFSLQQAAFAKNLDGYDCILGRWSKNDKTYTNYLLPKQFRLDKRSGDYFLFRK